MSFFKKQESRLVIALGLLAVALTFCTKRDPFGKELFDDQSGLTYTDTLTLRATLLEEDSVNTSLAPNHLLGIFVDPVFGKTEAVINTNFWPGVLGYQFAKDAVCDSAFIYLAYDPSRFYGDTTASQTVEVYRTEDVIKPDSNYHSTATAAVLGSPLGAVTFFPTPNTKHKLYDTSGVTTQIDTFGAFLRIPIDAAFGQLLLDLDSADLATTKAFSEKMRGLQFRATTPTGCMMSFNLNRSAFSRLSIFYRDSGTATRVRTRQFFLTANKWTAVKHDYAGSAVESSINKEIKDNLFVQGLAGLKMKIELPTLANLHQVTVNQAELELTVLEPSLPGDNALFTTPGQLLLSYYSDADSAYYFTPDVFDAAGSALAGDFSRFGGSNKTRDGVHKYFLNLSDHLQDIVSGKEPPVIYLNLFPQGQVVSRGIFVGTDKSLPLRAKVNLKYSKI